MAKNNINTLYQNYVGQKGDLRNFIGKRYRDLTYANGTYRIYYNGDGVNYSHLNYASAPVADFKALKEQQIAMIKAIERQNPNRQILNHFLKNLNTTMVTLQNGDIKSINEIIAKANLRLNQILIGDIGDSSYAGGVLTKVVTPQGKFHQYSGTDAQLQAYIDELDELIKIITKSQNSEAGQQIDQLLNQYKNNNLVDTTMYGKLKWQIWERLMLEVLEAFSGEVKPVLLHIANAYENGKRTTTDGFYFRYNTKVNFGGFNISIADVGDSKNKKPLDDKIENLEAIERICKQYTNKSIYFDQPIMDKLRQLALYTTQAKSGHSQPIMNGHAISIQTIIDQTASNSVLRMLRGLVEWREKDGGNEWHDKEGNAVNSNKILVYNEASETLRMILNYEGSKEVIKDVFTKNNLYFTSDGFVTASEWMTKHPAVIHFKNKVNTLQTIANEKNSQTMVLNSKV